MTDPGERLLNLAKALSDGEEVDRPRIEADAQDEEERELLTLLRDIGKVAEIYGVHLEGDAFEALVQEIPYRPRRHQVGGESLAAVSEAFDGGELSDGERSIVARKVEAALRSALCQLTAEDRVILKLRFLDGSTVKEIATALGVSERPLYPRLQRLFRFLREALEKQGSAETRPRPSGRSASRSTWSRLLRSHLRSTYT